MTKSLKIMSIAGARPNFMKLASIARAVDAYNSNIKRPVTIEHIIVHTGQHYDTKMSTGFFTDLGIPTPDVNLEVGSATHAVQTAEIMRRFEPVLLEVRPDVLLVVGDVNSTIACTLVAAKIEYPGDPIRLRPVIVHVEAGLRSFDRNMPEEINRILTDALSDQLFVTEQSGIDNLKGEGVAQEKIRFVGNVMIDTLIAHLEKSRTSDVKYRLGIEGRYILVTLHRPSNVDARTSLARLIDVIVTISGRERVVFPVHPRTMAKLKEFDLYDRLDKEKNILLTSPQGYLDFLNLILGSVMVVTDSGGIQEETTYLRIPCVTLRVNTERPVTVTEGSNYLTGVQSDQILDTVSRILDGQGKVSVVPALWDGRAGERIVEEIVKHTL